MGESRLDFNSRTRGLGLHVQPYGHIPPHPSDRSNANKYLRPLKSIMHIANTTRKHAVNKAN